jgi:hypothetical protein
MMEEQQLVAKITHLENQLTRLESFEFGIRNTKTIAGFFTGKINCYRESLENSAFNKPLSA